VRIALAFAAIGLVSWPVLRIGRQPESVSASLASQAAKPSDGAQEPFSDNLVPIHSAPPVSPLASALPADSTIIRVSRDDTIYLITIKAFGKYSKKNLAKLRELNPWLMDPRRIRVGQEIRVPSSTNATQTILPNAEQAPNALGTGMEKP
jgi:hypothetical protein